MVGHYMACTLLLTAVEKGTIKQENMFYTGVMHLLTCTWIHYVPSTGSLIEN